MNDCSICLVAVQSGFLLECGHCFHNRCITRWLLKNETCPVCRKEILDPIEVESDEEFDPVILVMDTFEDTFAPKNILESIKKDCENEIEEFLENIDNWTFLEKDEYVLGMVTQKKWRGKNKVKEEWQFSIHLSIIKHIYCFVIIIDEYKIFSNPRKQTNKHIFKNKIYSNTNRYRNKYKF
jgi:hypothetical protein